MLNERDEIIKQHIEFINKYIDSFVLWEKEISKSDGSYGRPSMKVLNLFFWVDFQELIKDIAIHSKERTCLPEKIISFIDNAFSLFALTKGTSFNEEDFPVFLDKMRGIIKNYKELEK